LIKTNPQHFSRTGHMPNPLIPFFKLSAIPLFFLIFFFLETPSTASKPFISVSDINIKQIEAISEMEICLDRLYAECLKVKQNDRLSYTFQDSILEKSGECINKIVELERTADLSKDAESDEFKTLFTKNGEILTFIITTNQESITEIQEEKLDKMKDVDAFLASPQWHTPHRLMSLSRYWMSWNEYYSSFLYPAKESIRMGLLGSAVKGFSLTLTDIEERIMIVKALFGRGLCFKELGKYDKALRDFDSVVQKARQDDPLYILSLYEMAFVNYRTGDFDGSMAQLERLDRKEDEKRVLELLGDRPRDLRVKVIFEPQVKRILGELKREKDKHGKNAKSLCREALHALQKLSHVDLSQTGNLYQLAEEYYFIYKDYTSDELGPVASLGVADAFFNGKKYDSAAERYAYVWNSTHPLVKRRIDDIYLRAGYCYCQTGQWFDALHCFDSLFQKFPDSDSIDKAVCLQYLAASGCYESNSDQANYARYIESIKMYLTRCSDPRDKDGARFQLGKYYHDKGETKEATSEFSAIEEVSSYYWPANYYLLKYEMDKLESLFKRGKSQTGIAKKYYKDIDSKIEKFQVLLKKREINPGVEETAAYMTILHARLLFNFGPEETQKDSLKILKNFENRFPHNHRIVLEAKDLRMSCFMKYGMITEAHHEISRLDLKSAVNDDLWALLNKWAGAYYRASKRLRDQEKHKLAGPQAVTAIMIYGKLSGIASRHASYSKYLDAIQLRWAELFMDENQPEKATNIYLEYLKRNPNSADALNYIGKIYEGEGNWKAALEVWRKFSRGLEAGSDQWFEYRWRIVNAYVMMGKNKEACEIISMTQVLHPNLENKKLIEEMERLKRESCKIKN